MNPAAEQLRRILHLIPTLADDKSHPIADVARRAGVDRATLLADLRSLADRFDDPGGFVEGVQVFLETERVQVRSDHFLRPMRLTASELCALELGLAILAGERPPEEKRAIARARDRLRRVIPKTPPNPIAEGTLAGQVGGPEHAALLARLRRAIGARHEIRLVYQASGASKPSPRRVRPYLLVFSSGMWYLVASADGAEGLRFFRLDRIVKDRDLSTRFDRLDEPALDEIVRSGKAFRADAADRLVVRYSAAIARWIAEREGKAPAADGTLTVEYPLADTDWAVRHVLQYGPDAEVLEPEDVREEIRRRLQRLA